MANQRISDEDLDQVLNSLAGLQKAEPKPFFFTRLQARMKRSENGFFQQLAAVVTRPAFAMITGIFILLLNGYFLLNTLEPNETQYEDSTQMLAVEYSGLNEPYYETEEAP